MESWSDLPEHIVEIFIEKIDSHRDFVISGAVCKLWHSVVTNNSNRLPHKLPLALCLPYGHPIPLLFQPSGATAKNSCFYSLTEKVFYGPAIPEIENKWIAGSSRGWLVTIEADGTLMHLLNPLTRTQIPLPSLSSFPEEELKIFENWKLYCCISKVIITSDPLSRKDDCLVIVIAGVQSCLYYCRIRDVCWNSIQGFSPTFLRDVIASNGLIYTVDEYGSLYCLEISNTVKVNVVTLPAIWLDNFEISLVESLGELLMCITRRRYGSTTNTVHFQVFKMVEIESPSSVSIQHSYDDRTHHSKLVRHKWKRVNSIGNMAIFLDCRSSKCLESSIHSDIKGNCIYFLKYSLCDDSSPVDSSNKCSHKFGVFHLEDGTVENITYLTSDNSLQFPTIWLEPNPK